jgi:Mg-chelatase subunit ChlD
VSFLSPIWLVLILPLAVVLYRFRPPTRFLAVVRALTLLAIVGGMARPVVWLPGRAGTVVVVADRSASMTPEALRNQDELIRTVADAMQSGERLAVVAFGREAVLEHPPQAGAFGGFVSVVNPDQSNLRAAFDQALAAIPREAAGRALVLSDGQWSGSDPLDAAVRAAARGIAVDFRLQERAVVGDLAIDRIQAPQQIGSGESFLITAWVQSPSRQTVRYALQRGRVCIAAGERECEAGMNRFVFRDRADAAGTQEYRLQVEGAANDPQLANNRARVLAGVSGNRPLLCVSAVAQGAFSTLLTAGGLDVHTLTPSQARWSLAELSNYSAVLLENVPASAIGPPGMELLAAWVETSGAGLMMTGGRNAYGPGGYFRSPLERVLPVSMELKREHRKFNLAIVIAMDRSGSMAAAAGVGRTKMDLANIGAVQVLDLLSDDDEFGVLAVDSQAHTVLNLAPVSVNRGQRGRVLEVESMGGGIFVYEALQAATRMLLKSEAQTRHIVLFADAADSEEPGAYVELLKKCAAANITCSVVGLGTEIDCDAALLRDIARLGDGLSFFSNDAAEIPRLFAQDTFAVTRSALVDEPTAVSFTPGYALLSATAPPAPAPVLGGYNLCYIRPEANLAAVTEDSYQAPVIATWQAGRGRVLCYTGEADGPHTGPMASWPGVGDCFVGQARWVAGGSGLLPAGLLLTQAVREGVCRLTLHLDPDRSVAPFTGVPRAVFLHGVMGAAPRRKALDMAWVSADRLEAEFTLSGDETALPTVTVPGVAPITLAPVCLPYSPEFRPVTAGSGHAALARLAEATGGGERLDVAAIWRALPSRVRMLDTAWLCYVLAIGLLLLDVLQRRTGVLTRGLGGGHSPARWRWGGWRRAPRRERAVGKPTRARPQEAPPPPPSAPADAPPSSANATSADETLRAMEQVRQRAGKRR